MIENYFSYFSTKPYAMCSQKYGLNETYMLYIIFYNYKGIKWERAQRVNHLISL